MLRPQSIACGALLLPEGGCHLNRLEGYAASSIEPISGFHECTKTSTPAAALVRIRCVKWLAASRLTYPAPVKQLVGSGLGLGLGLGFGLLTLTVPIPLTWQAARSGLWRAPAT